MAGAVALIKPLPNIAIQMRVGYDVIVIYRRQFYYFLTLQRGFEMNADFDFQEWACLAKTDPEAFEQRRVEYIAQFLSGSGKHRRRLEGLQFKIDAARKLAHTPEKALVVISKMMVKSLNELGKELKCLSDETKKPSASEGASTPSAKELPSCEVIYMLPRQDPSLDKLHV